MSSHAGESVRSRDIFLDLHSCFQQTIQYLVTISFFPTSPSPLPNPKSNPVSWHISLYILFPPPFLAEPN